MTTRAGLRSVIRERLADETQWPDATLNQWINDAIADYSVYFPSRETTASIDCVADQIEYSLSSYTGIKAMIRVEYPGGEDPYELLAYRGETDPRGFYGCSGFYYVRGDPPLTLVLAEKPSSGETIEITYRAAHSYLSADDDVLTVCDEHLEGLVLFVWWKAAQELLAAEAKDPQVTTLLLTQHDMMVYRAAREYRNWLRDTTSAGVGRSAVVSWGDVGL